MRFIILTGTFVFVLHLSSENVSVPKLSAPEKHSLVLVCARASDVDWSHGLRGVIASKRGQQVSYLDRSKHQLLSDGALHIRDLQPSDAGQYYCNRQLIADIAVLKESTDVENNSPGMNTNLTVSVLLALCLLAIVCVCVCLLAAVLSCRRTRTNARKESGRWMSDAHEDTGEVLYASLGVQLCRDTDGQMNSRQNVIYSTLLTRPKSS